MNRTVAIIIAALVLASAGWWGWTRPDLLPGSTPDTPAPTRPAPRPVAATPHTATPEPEPEPQPAGPVPTPAPQDAALPPETGSEAARETEAVAEAAIAAADARARAEATARAEHQAVEAAQAELRQALSPFLTATGFSSATMRDRLSTLPAPASAAIGQARDRLLREIAAILDEADAAAGEAGSATILAAPDTGPPGAEPAPAFRPAAYITRIEQLL